MEYSITASDIAKRIGCDRQDIYSSASYALLIKKEYYVEITDRPLSWKKDIDLLTEYDNVRKSFLGGAESEIYKAVHERENKCKELHKEMNLNVGPTRLVQPDFYLLVDVDDIQRQMNALENEVHCMKK